MDKSFIKTYLQGIQNQICQALEVTDGLGRFKEDLWQREGGGGGRTRVIEHGAIIERGCVNFSEVFGKTPEKVLKDLRIEEDVNFYATGVSIVMHPNNPMVPIIHMNVRYFEMSNGIYWFGGGIDLTPHYIDKEDACYFHQQLKKVCDRHHSSYYLTFKKWADNYFFLKHREETRGVGGIFFDRLYETDTISKEQRFEFVKDVAHTFTPIYTHFMKKNSVLPYGEKEKSWQLFRRSRYIEFNLIWDIGTRFGLETNGRAESILMSMPPLAKWAYDYQPADAREQETLALLKKEIDWVNG
ncbi:MAG: oxygen-dependent coproporphyrinogen oxidase [Cytophagales bacterium]|nr:oxygen-dependent coproporphyrinogen oxidase [Cytophagales bacterium]